MNTDMWEFSVCGLGVRKKYDIKKNKFVYKTCKHRLELQDPR